MSQWLDLMDSLNQLANFSFGEPTIYLRSGHSPFAITGQPHFLDRLEDPSRGQFYSIFYRSADFDAATFSAQVIAKFTGHPNDGGTIVFDGVAYTAVTGLDNSQPNQFLRGSSPMGAAANLSACINADPALAGTFFSSSTVAHPTCSAQWQENPDGVTGSTIVSARAAGIAGNSFLASDYMSFVSLDSQLFYGGGPLENDLVTLYNVLYRVSDVPEPDPEGTIQLRLEKKAL